MAENNQTINTLQGLLDYNAGKFTSGEIQLQKSLPEWINMATSLQLKVILEKYYDLVELHIKKMEVFFEEEKILSLGFHNRVMQSYIEELNEALSKCADSKIKDACIVAGLQAINHLKISSYGTAAAFANTLEMEKQAAIFHEAEINEKQIDDRLSQLAAHEINPVAKTTILISGEK
jgi:ferritin-like metal-binding protein YciE